MMPALFCCSPIYWRGFEPVVEASTNSFHYHYRLHLDYFDICRSFRFQPKECSSISSFSKSCLLFTITVNFNTTSWNKLALVGTACFISGLLLLYLPYHSQGIIHDFAVNLFNGYVYSSASILSMGLSFAVFLSVFKLCLKY